MACVEAGRVFDGASIESRVRRHSKSHLLELPADFLAAILLGRVSGLVADPRGVRLANCHITGALDLRRAAMQVPQADRAVLPLQCDKVTFEQPLNVAYASTGAISLTRCELPEFIARGADIATDLTLDDCTLIAAVERDREGEANGAADRATDGARRTYRLIDLDGATIGGDFSAKRLRHKQQAAPADKVGPPGPLPYADILIDADNVRIGGGVDLSAVHDPMQRQSAVRLAVLMGNFDNADVFGDFRAIGTWFSTTSAGGAEQPPEPSKGSAEQPPNSGVVRARKCLDLRGAHVRGDVELDHVIAAGEIHLEDATLTQDLSLGGAKLVNVERATGLAGVVLQAMGLTVRGSVHFVDRREVRKRVIERPVDEEATDDGKQANETIPTDVRLLAVGQVRMTRSRIDGDLDASGATICAVGLSVEGVALDLRSAEFGGSLFLDGRRDVGPGLFVGLVNLINVRVAGSVVFSGSWFRAPAGQQMGPQRIHRKAIRDHTDEPEPTDEPTSGGWSLADRSHVERTEQELADWTRYRLPHFCWSARDPAERSIFGRLTGNQNDLPTYASLSQDEPDPATAGSTGYMRDLLTNLGVLPALRLSRWELWRLRGGCRAVAMVDAEIKGSVLFGIGPVARGDPATGDPKRSREAPSIVVGCVDLDRITVGGDLRLTGGVFRAVTPYIAPEERKQKQDESSAKTQKQGKGPEGTGSGSVDGGGSATRHTPPDISMSNPSTPGWMELKARVCLSLQSGRITGRLDTRFFGPMHVRDWNYQCDPIAKSNCDDAQANSSRRGPKYTNVLECIGRKTLDCSKQIDIFEELTFVRSRIKIVPDSKVFDEFLHEHVEPSRDGGAEQTRKERIDQPGEAFSAVDLKRSHNPANFVDEMLWMLNFAAWAETRDDETLGASLPSIPKVHQLDGRWYPLRPDGLFDLSGAKLSTIHDHPCHGWPTSDGHLELNGCTYNFISLTHEPSYRRANTTTHDGSKPSMELPDGLFQLHGTSPMQRLMVWCIWRVLITLLWLYRGSCGFLYWICRANNFLGVHDRGKPYCATLFPGVRCETQRMEALRYVEYAVASFRIRKNHDASAQARRIKWLEQQFPGRGPSSRDFRPQPYEQLARVMRDTGYSLDADAIATAKRNMRLRARVFGKIQRVFDGFLFVTCKYTYSPTVISAWLIAITMIAVVVSGTAYDRGMLARADGAGEFSPWLYAGDVMIPIVEFGYVDDWIVGQPVEEQPNRGSGTADRSSDIQGDNWIGRFMAFVGDTLFNLLCIDSARSLHWAFGLLTGLGTLFTALAVITFTGVMRRD